MTGRGAFLCVDIGTSSIKAAFIAPDGQLIAGTRIPYNIPADSILPAQAWENAFFRACRRLDEKAPGTPVLAIAVSGNGPTLVPLDAAGTALAPLHWHEAVDPRWRGTGGPSLFLPAVSQFLHTRKEDALRTRLLVSAPEWLLYRLGAEAVTSLPNRHYTPWYWTQDELAARGLEASWFPPFAAPGSIVGRLSHAAQVAGSIGDGKGTSGIPLVAGGPDFFMAILGTACIDPGLACDRAGSSEGINYCASGPAPVEGLAPAAGPPSGPLPGGSLPGGPALRTLPHWVEGLWNVSAILPPTGKRFEDFRQASGQGNRRYRDILADIDAAGSCTGPVCNPLAQAGRAIVEGLGYTVRAGIDRLEAAGLPVRALRLSGGQARNDTWNQLKADILGVPLAVGPIRDAELLGDAALCLVAVGAMADPLEAARRLWREERVWEPEPGRAAFYRERTIEAFASAVVKATTPAGVEAFSPEGAGTTGDGEGHP